MVIQRGTGTSVARFILKALSEGRRVCPPPRLMETGGALERAKPPPSTVTASQKGITRQRTAAMHTSDIAIHNSPCERPKMKVSGSGLPRTKAQSSRDK